MKIHKGFTLIESVVCFILLSPLLFLVAEYMEQIGNTAGHTFQTIQQNQSVSLFLREFSNDIKSADWIEADEHCLSLISTSQYIMYEFDSVHGELTRSNDKGSIVVLHGFETGLFIPVDSDAVGIYLSMDGTVIDTTINRS